MTIFGICSSINAPNTGVFSVQERFDQTLITIESIRKKCDQSFIILCENTSIDQSHKTCLNEAVDLFITTHGVGSDKSKSEVKQMIRIIDEIKKNDYNTFFKISGRYYLDENFDISNFDNDQINFREFDWSGRHCFSTVLYSFSKKHESLMADCYMQYLRENPSFDIETGMYNMLRDQANRVDRLGVAGCLAPSGERLEH